MSPPIAWSPGQIPDVPSPLTPAVAAPVFAIAFTNPSTPGVSLPQGTAVVVTGTISAPASSVVISLASGRSVGSATIDNTALTFSYSYTPRADDFGSQTLTATGTPAGVGANGVATASILITEPAVMALANGMVGRWNVDGANSQAEAGAITSITDASGAGGPFTGGTGFTMRTARWNANMSGVATDQRAIHCINAQKMFAASAQLIAAFNGTNKPFTVIDVYQDLNAGLSTLWSAENTYPYVLSLRKAAQLMDYQDQSTHSHVFSTVETQGPQVRHFERTPTAINMFVNGIADAGNPVAYTDANAYAVTKLSWGEQDGTALATMLHRERIVFNRVLTSQERADVTARLAYSHGLDWCAAIGQGLGTTGKDVVVIPVVGSSNAAGQGATRYARVCDDVYTLDWDFFVRPVPKGEPISLTVQANTVPPTLTRPLGGASDADAWGALADTLKADPQFAGKALLFVPMGVGLFSSTSCTAGTGTTPRDITTGYGQYWHRVKYALRAKNAVLGPTVIYQGEVQATISLAASTTTLTSDWTTFFSTVNTDFAGKFLKACHFIALVMPPTVPGSIDPTNWAAVRTTWNALPGSVSSLQVVPCCDGPNTSNGVNLHRDTGTASPQTGLRGEGVRVANAYLAAS